MLPFIFPFALPAGMVRLLPVLLAVVCDLPRTGMGGLDVIVLPGVADRVVDSGSAKGGVGGRPMEGTMDNCEAAVG